MTQAGMRLKRVAEIGAGQSPPSQEVFPYRGEGLPFLQGNAEFGQANPVAVHRCDSAPRIARRGDLLVSVRAPVGAVNTADRPYGIGRGLASVRPVAIDARYAHWLLSHASEWLNSVANGSTFSAVTGSDVGDIVVPVTALTQQRAIADFLDRETAQIDAFIAKNEELITLLTERRVAVINAPFSAHDANARLAHACEAVVDCPHTTPAVDDDGGFEAVRTASVRDGRFVRGQGLAVSEGTWLARNGRSGPRLGDVLFTREAPAGEACMVPSTDVCLGQRMVLLRIDASKADGEFLMWQLYSREVQQYFELAANGSTVTNIRLPLLRATPIWLPDLAEQRAVRRELVKSLRSIEDALEAARNGIELARERRAALISAAVTGKISVGV